MLVVLLGPPGVGKGTQARRLVAELGVPHISTGEMLRDEIEKNTELGQQAGKVPSRWPVGAGRPGGTNGGQPPTPTGLSSRLFDGRFSTNCPTSPRLRRIFRQVRSGDLSRVEIGGFRGASYASV